LQPVYFGPVRIIFIGDIVGHVGLREVVRQLPELRQRFSADCIIVNGENIVDGKGLSEKEAEELFQAGANCITTGNHVWENWKSRMPGAPAKVIDALLLHRDMSQQQLCIATGVPRGSMTNVISRLNRAGLISKNGGRISLKEL
jgi:hypothetical protein